MQHSDMISSISRNTYQTALALFTGYQEKFYFTPGDTGFKVFHTKVGVVGVAICWDQWFPEAARAMALQGADVLLYPTAIGSEPQDPSLNSADHWQRVMQGHSAANVSSRADFFTANKTLLKNSSLITNCASFHFLSVTDDSCGCI